LNKRKEKREFERQKAYNLLSQNSPNSQPAAKEPTATQGRDLLATNLPDQLRQKKTSLQDPQTTNYQAYKAPRPVTNRRKQQAGKSKFLVIQ
jgi:hypothetical protein